MQCGKNPGPDGPEEETVGRYDSAGGGLWYLLMGLYVTPEGDREPVE